MSDLDWPMTILAGWFGVRLCCFARQVWDIWRPTPQPKFRPIGIQILHRAVDAAVRYEGGTLRVFCSSDTPCDVFAVASNHLDRRGP